MKDFMRARWIAGDFGAIAREIGAPEAENFVARMELEPGARVLDIACGTGNATIPLARRGTRATGLDMMPLLLEEARARAAREGLPIRFDEGFAEKLPYPDGSFDVVVSMFGIMFSPLPETVASEMARVLKPGGRLALANWTASGFGAKMGAVVGRYLPPPPEGTRSPFNLSSADGLWGEDAKVRGTLNPGFDAVETRVVAISWELQRSAADAAEFFAKNSGPIQLALARLDAPKRTALLHDLEELWIDNNLATDGEKHTLISNEYLQVLARRR
ncbi:MAG: class I SAM-dependent methyltransferase [Verrucomicrobia bacterium]|nr:class I SAM-dependent methyltransferase [Verrucomicrobiota bacterium]